MNFSSLHKDTLLNLFGFAIPAVAAIPALAILARHLPPSEFGFFILLTSLGAFASVFDFGIGRYITVKLAMSKSNIKTNTNQLVVDALFSACIISTLIFLLVLFFCNDITSSFAAGEWRKEDLKLLVIVTLVTIELSAFIQITQSALEGEFKFLEANKIKLLGGVLQSWLPVAFVFISNELLYGMVAILLSRLLTLIFGLSFLKLNILDLRKVTINSMRCIYSGALPLAISGLSSLIMTNADRIMVSSLLGGSTGSVYTTASDFLNRNAVMPGAFLRALLPRLVIDGNKHDDNVFFRFSVFTLIISVITILFSKQLLLFMFGPFFSGYYEILQIMSIGFLFNVVGGYYIALINARGRNYICAVLHTVELPLFFGVLIYLSLHYGVKGSAVAYCLRCIFDCLSLRFLNKYQKGYGA